MNFNDFDKQNEVKMSPEEEKTHKSFLPARHLLCRLSTHHKNDP